MRFSSFPDRRAALFSLALVAALSTESFTLLQRAEAISASAAEAAAYQPAVSPRELGASIPATVSVRNVEAPAPQTTSPREVAAENTGTTQRERRSDRRDRRRRQRDASREEETTVAERRTTTRQRTRVAAREERTTSSKEGPYDKKAVIPPPAPTGPQFTISSGWQSRYIFHGLDIISFNSRYRLDPTNTQTREESSSIWFTDFSVSWKGLRAGVGYVQAVDPTVPYFQGPSVVQTAAGFFLASRDRGRPTAFGILRDEVRLYREVNVHLDYTFSLVPSWLDTTVGYNSYFFPNHDFKGTSYQGEIPIRLTFTRIPYVRPSFTYYRYISDYKKFEAGNLNGNYVEFRLDAGFPLYTSRNFAIAIAPYALVSYNINYLKFGGDYDVGGFNTFETGLKLPIRIGKHFSVTPFGNFGANLSDADVVANNFAASTARGTGGSRSFGEQTRFWGGVNLAYSF